MEDVVLKISGKMKEIEIDPISEDGDLETVTAEDFADDDLENLDAETTEKITYEVWLLGRGEYDEVNEFGYLVDGDYTDVNEALKCYNFIKENGIQVIKNKDEDFYIPADVYSVDLVVEEVVADEDYSECINIEAETNIKIK